MALGNAAVEGWTRIVDGLSAVFTPDGGKLGHPGVQGWVTFAQDEFDDAEFTPGESADGPPESLERRARPPGSRAGHGGSQPGRRVR